MIIHHGQIRHFKQAVIGRKHGFGFAAQLEDAGVLKFGLRKGDMDGRLKSGEDIRAGDENILHTTALQAVEHERSELGTFLFVSQYVLINGPEAAAATLLPQAVFLSVPSDMNISNASLFDVLSFLLRT